MPTSVDILWGTMKKEDFSTAKALIQAHPELVNATHPQTGHTFPIQLIRATTNYRLGKPRDLLRFVLTHPQMNWNFQHKKQTPASVILDAVFADQDFTIIESLQDVDGFIFSNNQLTYELAVKELRDMEQCLQQQVRANESQEELDDTRESVAIAKKIVALIRDITILRAIKTDNADLFDRLAQAGGEPFDKLGNFGKNEYPNLLVGIVQPNPRIEAWQREMFARQADRRTEKLKTTEKNLDRYRMFNNHNDQINAKYHAKEVAIHEQAAAQRLDRIHAAVIVRA